MWDQEAELLYLRARYYEPETGRFLSRDTYEGTLSNPLSRNLYAYVGNNLVNRIDPSGHMWVNNEWIYEEIHNGRTYARLGDLVKTLGGSINYFGKGRVNIATLNGMSLEFKPSEYLVKGGQILIKVRDFLKNFEMEKESVLSWNQHFGYES